MSTGSAGISTGSAPIDDLRIVFVNWRDIGHPEAGGAERYAWELARRLAARGAHVTFLTARHPDSARHETLDGVKIVRRGAALTVYPAAMAWLAMHRRSVDVVIDCQNGIPFFSPLVVGKKMPVILVVHHIHQEQFATRFSPRMAAFGRALEGPVSRFVYRKHTIAAVSPSTRDGIRRRLNLGAPVVIVPNGTPDVVATHAQRSATPRILCLGRLVPHKRVDLLLRAAAELKQHWPDLTVDIVGGGSGRAELEKLADSLGLGSTVTFHGRVDESTKADLLAQAWISVNPSMGEGWGITVMEAAAAGLPSLAFDVAGLRDSILDDQTGWLIAEGSELSAGIEAALHRLANSPSDDHWSANAKAWAACFSWDDSTTRLEGLVLDEIGRGARRAAGTEQRRRTDAACVLEVDGLDPAQAVALRRTLRSTDVMTVSGEHARVLLYGCDERDGRLVVKRAKLTGNVHVRVAQHRDLLTVQDGPEWRKNIELTP